MIVTTNYIPYPLPENMSFGFDSVNRIAVFYLGNKSWSLRSGLVIRYQTRSVTWLITKVNEFGIELIYSNTSIPVFYYWFQFIKEFNFTSTLEIV